MDRTTGPFPSYEPFRKCVAGIYDVEPPLPVTVKASRASIETDVRRACKGKDEDLNLEVALCLFDFLESFDQRAFTHDTRTLRLGTDRKCFFRIEHYLVREERAIFQFPYPRKTRLDPQTHRVMMSLVHYAYAVDDFADASVELLDLSCDPGDRFSKPLRAPRLISLEPEDLLDRSDLESRVQEVYTILMALAEETP